LLARYALFPSTPLFRSPLVRAAGKQAPARLVARIGAGRRQRRHDLEVLAGRGVLEAADLRELAQIAVAATLSRADRQERAIGAGVDADHVEAPRLLGRAPSEAELIEGYRHLDRVAVVV